MNRSAGICLTLSSLRTDQSCGVGEIPDLLPLLPWVVGAGFQIIQLLPLNDTGPDASPYAAISSFAVNPIYLGLKRLPYVEHLPHLRAQLDAWSQGHPLWFEYGAIRQAKKKWVEEYLEAIGHHLLAEPLCVQWCADNADWLTPYTEFLWNAEQHKESDWTRWPARNLLTPCPERVRHQIWLTQYLCWQQLMEVRAAADAQGVLLLGDLPILVQKESADVWADTHLFDLSLAAGAPADQYSADGQVWGFPLYAWSEHIKEDFRWWRRRLSVWSAAFHMYRLDHVLGFFRFWAVPPGGRADEGFFVPEEPGAWVPQGRAILEVLLGSSPMQPVAEDLGVPIPGLTDVLTELSIPGIRVHRWTRRWETDGSFIPVEEYPFWSVACLSTHDSSLVGAWWQEEPEAARAVCLQQQWQYLPQITTELRRELVFLLHRAASCFHVNLLLEYLALFPDLMPPELADRRINTPGTLHPYNWTLRLPMTVEQMVQHAGLQTCMQQCAALTKAVPMPSA